MIKTLQVAQEKQVELELLEFAELLFSLVMLCIADIHCQDCGANWTETLSESEQVNFEDDCFCSDCYSDNLTIYKQYFPRTEVL